jgi:general secretion pathway protein K
VQVRNAATYFRTVEDFNAHLANNTPAAPNNPYPIDVKSDFFEVHSRLRLDKLVVEERAVLERTGVSTVRVDSRERGTGDPTTLSRIAMSQR